jgi:uncharacterized membrane protein YbhN (UPF0104 family)
MRGGFASRAIYLKKKHGLFYSYMPSLIVTSTILSFIVGGIVILITNAFWVFMEKSVLWPLVIFGGILSLSAFVLFLKPPSFLLNLPGEIGKSVRLSCQGWETMRHNVKSMSAVCGYHLLIIFVSSILIITGFCAVKLPLSFPAAVGISVINTFTGVVNLVPANLGIQEWTTAFIAKLSGLNFHVSVAAALVIRTAGIIVNIVGGTIGYYLLFLRPSKR